MKNRLGGRGKESGGKWGDKSQRQLLTTLAMFHGTSISVADENISNGGYPHLSTWRQWLVHASCVQTFSQRPQQQKEKIQVWNMAQSATQIWGSLSFPTDIHFLKRLQSFVPLLVFLSVAANKWLWIQIQLAVFKTSWVSSTTSRIQNSRNFEYEYK